MAWRSHGDFRQRARHAERATERHREQRRQMAAARTHQAIRDFEEGLRAQIESAQNVDDLPAEADAGTLDARGIDALRGALPLSRQSSESSVEHGDRPDRDRAPPGISRSHSDFHAQRHDLGGPKRPPSPLAFYDYGNISVKPRSVLAQQRLRDDVRPKRQTASCFYFPGPEHKQGPYGFSMLDPCLLPQRCWALSKTVPARYPSSGDARPLTSEVLRQRTWSAGEVSSVRTNSAHSSRVRRAFRQLDRSRGDGVLEHARFEGGVFDGRWADPLLERKGQLPEEGPPERQDWLRVPLEGLGPQHRLARRILEGLNDALRRSRGSLATIFAPQGREPPGVLELEHFLGGLVKHGIMAEGEVGQAALVAALFVIDSSFDGRVSLPKVARALVAARSILGKQAKDIERVQQQREETICNSYGGSLPVEVVRVDRECRSIYTFARTFERFRRQQRELLILHNEAGPDQG